MNKTMVVFLVVVLFSLPGLLYADQFRIAIMQNKKGEAGKVDPLLKYFQKNGVEASLVTTKNYIHAAKMFESGQADAMFSGSGVAGIMIIKEVAHPMVRPLSEDGWSTYRAVLIALKGSPRFTKTVDYFKDKRVVYNRLASSGEFFFRSMPGSGDVGAITTSVSSDEAAIDALSRGIADVAIVKNRVWDSLMDKYPGLEQVGEASGENPNDTLIVSNNTEISLVSRVRSILLGLEGDESPEAKAVKKELKVKSYIETTLADFKYTLPMLEQAGVKK
jgi:ABC-type phosphate/phosphonate transport system substrate-binding protein